MNQIRWQPFGWNVILTWSHGFGIGFWWRHLRYNGVDFFLGPVTLTVQPPLPVDWENQTP